MLLVFDVGTTALKGALFTRGGQMHGRAERPLALIPSADPLVQECDALEWVSALREVVAELLGARADRSGGRIEGPIQAVVVSGNGPTLVAVDGSGQPVAPAMTWMDRRGTEEAAIVSRKAGGPVDATFYLPKALWLFRNRPDLYERTTHFLPCPEFLSFLMTGEALTFLPAPQFARYIWGPSLIAAVGMDPTRFPPFVSCGTKIGSVTETGEARLGIPRGVPVVAGGPDFVVSLLGTATVRTGRACIRSGTSEGVNVVWPTAIADPRLLSLGHVIPGLFNISGSISTSGKALEWFRRLTGETRLAYEEIFRRIEEVPPGARGLLFLPYLTGERAPLWDASARGAFLGLSLSHGLPEMTRAVAESTGFAIRDVMEVMTEDGLSIRDLRITGTPSRSPVWNQIKADITGHPILAPAILDSDLAGDASLALFALGDYPSLVDASEAIVSMGTTYEPRSQYRSRYDELFSAYRQAYQGLKMIFPTLSATRRAE
ncbi:MAG TPA: FGGY-family carbohydrate kinase [Spirochaetia bacterium]|nr:FGGY-family carbohydrate kinase [Spirochaetia bacterium]